MQRAVPPIILAVLAFASAPTAAEGQATWPPTRTGTTELHWTVGTFLPASTLGAFDAYRIHMDPWFTAGVSLQPWGKQGRFRNRFEILLVPGVAMRRAPARAECEDCTSDSVRLTLLGAGYLVDFTFPFVEGTRAFVTAGPTVRMQLSDVRDCHAARGRDCALAQFARDRIDPGLLLGLGWEPPSERIKAIQLTGRVSHYGRAARPEAAPRSWIPELGLGVRFTR
jgi:hypothetical protein